MFGDLFIVDRGDYRHLRFGAPDGIDQSVICRSDPDIVTTEYVSAACLALLLAKRRRRVLVAGLGGGSLLRTLRRLFPKTHVDVVEIDPAVVRCAKRYFAIAEDRLLTVHTVDIAEYLQHGTQRYDVVFLDAFDDRGMPAHLTVRSFFEAVRDALHPAGVAVLNVAFTSVRSERALAERFRKVWSAVSVMRAELANNLLLFGRPAAPRRVSTCHESLVRRAQRLDGRPGAAVGQLVASARRWAGWCREHRKARASPSIR
jgi:spermidine synthase